MPGVQWCFGLIGRKHTYWGFSLRREEEECSMFLLFWIFRVLPKGLTLGPNRELTYFHTWWLQLTAEKPENLQCHRQIPDRARDYELLKKWVSFSNWGILCTGPEKLLPQKVIKVPRILAGEVLPLHKASL